MTLGTSTAGPTDSFTLGGHLGMFSFLQRRDRRYRRDHASYNILLDHFSGSKNDDAVDRHRLIVLTGHMTFETAGSCVKALRRLSFAKVDSVY